MNLIQKLALFVVLTAGASQSFGRCMEDQTKNCNVNGKMGTMSCTDGDWTKCEIPEPPVPPETGLVTLDYIVVSVIYAPPGNPSAEGNVSYKSESKLGTTISFTSTFKNTATVTASGSVAGGELSTASSSARKDSVTVSMSRGGTTNVSGPNSIGGINHNYDQIWIWPHAKIAFTISADGNSVGWSPDMGGVSLTYVTVGQLNGSFPMSAETKRFLDSIGVPQSKYASLIANSAFATNPDRATLPPPRYMYWGNAPYKGPETVQDKTNNYEKEFATEDIATKAADFETENKASFFIGADNVSFLGLFKATMKFTDEFNVTLHNTTELTRSNNQKASVKIAGPGFGYSGPEWVDVYFDTVFNSWAFIMRADSTVPPMKGVLRSVSGKPLAGRKVTLRYDGGITNALTDSEGRFRIFRPVKGAISLRVDGVPRKAFQSTTAARLRSIAVDIP